MSDVIITKMNVKNRAIRSSEVINIAFAVVFFASYLSTYQLFRISSIIELGVFIILGIAYLSLGIYGYETIRKVDIFSWILTYFFVQCILGGIIVSFQGHSGLNALILLPLVAQAVLSLRGYWAYGINLLILIIYSISSLLIGNDLQTLFSGLPGFLAGQFFILVFTQMALDEENARVSVQLLADELAEANDELRRYATNVEELTLARERNRMAREIHDGLGHSLTIILMLLQACKATINITPSRAAELVEDSLDQTRLALVEVRNSVFALHTGSEGQILLTKRIQNLMETSKKTGLLPTMEVIGEPKPVNPHVELVVYRTLQECISNTIKHAKANTINVVMDFSKPHYLYFEYFDDGVGTEKLVEGFGLTGIRERIKMMKGTINIENDAATGIRIQFEVPC